MGASTFVRSAVTRELRPVVRRIGLALGLAFVVLVVVPTSFALAVALSGGHGLFALGLLAFGVLGFLLLLVAIPIAILGVAWVLLGAATAAVEASVTEKRLRVLDWAETVEETRWWGPLVQPTERLSFVDPFTADERLAAEVARAKSAYVSGKLSEVALERRLDRLFGIETDAIRSRLDSGYDLGFAHRVIDPLERDQRDEY